MERPIPANIDAERSVIGACLLERDAIIALAPLLAPDDFYLEKHAWIWEAILSCCGYLMISAMMSLPPLFIDH
jgi:replicative DNA helicase